MQKKISAVVIIVVLFAGITIGVFAFPFMQNSIESFLPSQQQTSNPKVTVVAGQIANITFENGKYAFTYQPENSYTLNQKATFTVYTPVNYFLAPNYDAIPGAVYDVSGIRVTVTEVHVNYIILNIESNILNSNAPIIVPTPSSTLSVSKIGKAIQIQSVTSNVVYVQNVGDLEVLFSGQSVYVDGVFPGTIDGSGSLAPGATMTFALMTPIGAGTHTIKVVTTDGVFSQITKTFP
jgi:hypothetical protein